MNICDYNISVTFLSTDACDKLHLTRSCSVAPHSVCKAWGEYGPNSITAGVVFIIEVTAATEGRLSISGGTCCKSSLDVSFVWHVCFGLAIICFLIILVRDVLIVLDVLTYGTIEGSFVIFPFPVLSFALPDCLVQLF